MTTHYYSINTEKGREVAVFRDYTKARKLLLKTRKENPGHIYYIVRGTIKYDKAVSTCTTRKLRG